MDIYNAKDYLAFLLSKVSNEFEREMYRKMIYEPNKCKKIRILPNIPFNLFHIPRFKPVVRALMLVSSVKICLTMQANNLSKSMYDIIYNYVGTLYDMLYELCVYYNKRVGSCDNLLVENNDDRVFHLADELCEIIKT